MDPSLMDQNAGPPTPQKGSVAAEEASLATLRPSARVVIPSVAWWLSIALGVSALAFYVAINRPGLAQLVEALSIIGGVVCIGVLLALTNRIRHARTTGGPMVPGMVWVILFRLMAAVVVGLVAAVGFEATYQAMLDLGATSAVALAVGLAFVLLVFVLIR